MLSRRPFAAPTTPLMVAAVTTAPRPRSSPDGPAFNAFAYTLDVLLPVIDLGQQKAWQPHGTAMYCSWALIAAGWS